MTATLPPCPLCASTSTRLERTLQRAAIIDEWKRGLDLDLSGELVGMEEIPQWRCANCDLVFFPPAASGSGALYEALQRFPWYYLPDKWEYGEALRDVPQGARLCEPGCGRGDFLARAIRERGVDGLGVELNEDAARTARERGLPVEAKPLAAVVATQAGQFDVVCSFQVLEHVPDPGAHLREARALLKPGGRLLLGLPNTESFLGREDNGLDRPPHHISRWSFRTIERAFPALGFRVMRRATEPLTPLHTIPYLHTECRTRLAPMLPRPLAWLVTRHTPHVVLGKLLIWTGLHRFLRGQTLYVMAVRTD